MRHLDQGRLTVRRAVQVLRADAADAWWAFTHPGAAWRHLYATTPRVSLLSLQVMTQNISLLSMLLAAAIAPPPPLRIDWQPATPAEIHQHQVDVLAECLLLHRETGQQC